ncbi:hypothetical protein LEL_10572 [Akanthomyces lecanii RCEF 1005]|uniref:MADS-box domain-containing protein n=1 Tax=Akanthomyces lecanii RCEF 1005 TaxID=1081108 RepID=A0A167XLK2_CORDF|nr:hypothetical protein LEL_10572 [Akanthomyces lecanii RCEF 1005]
MARAVTRAAARAAVAAGPVTRAVASRTNNSRPAAGRTSSRNASRAAAAEPSAAPTARISRTAEQKRREMFRKRTDTLTKKARELHDNTGAEVYVVFRDKHMAPWPDDSQHGFDGCAFGEEAPGNIKQVLDQVHTTGRRPRKRGPRKGARAARARAADGCPTHSQYTDFVGPGEQFLYDIPEEGEAMPDDASDADQNIAVEEEGREEALLAGLASVSESMRGVLPDQDGAVHGDAPGEVDMSNMTPCDGNATSLPGIELEGTRDGVPEALYPEQSTFAGFEYFEDFLPAHDDQDEFSAMLSGNENFLDFMPVDQDYSFQAELFQPSLPNDATMEPSLQAPQKTEPHDYNQEREDAETGKSPPARLNEDRTRSRKAKITIIKDMLTIINDHWKVSSNKNIAM